MDKKRTVDPATKRRYEKKYRQKLLHEEVVRVLLYVKKDSLPYFQDQVYQRSQEYMSVHSQRSREKRAKIAWFEDAVRNRNHEYWRQRDELEHAQRENAALAPRFLQTKDLDHVPVPSAIQQLDNDPKKLKQQLTVSDRERKHATQLLSDYQDQAKRARLAKDLAEKRVELLEQRLIEHGLSTEVEVLI